MKKTLLMRLTFIGILLFFGVQATVAQDTLLSDSTKRVNCAQAQLFLQHYRFEAALGALNACFEQDTSNTEYLRKKALCYYKLGRFQEAEATYYAILETDSNNVNALNQLGVIYSNQSNYRAAVEQYERLSAIDTANSYYHKVLGSLFYKLKVIDYAMGHDQLALELNPNDVEAIAHLTKIYQSMEQYELADELIVKGLELDSSNATLYHYQLKSAYRQHNYAGVLGSAQYLMQLEQDTSAYLLKMMGIAHFHTGDYALSASLLEKVVDNDKAKEQLHYYIGLAYREMGDAETSEKHFEQAIENGISDNISIYYTNLAIAFEEQGNYAEAIRAYQMAYKSSQNKILLYHLARNYDAYYGDKETALRYYEKYLEANDTGNVRFKDYSKHRISEIKEVIHFDIDTLR